MNEKMYSTIASMMFLISCSSAEIESIEDNIGKSNNIAETEQISETDGFDKQISDSSEGDVALAPVMISGAFLACSLLKDGVTLVCKGDVNQESLESITILDSFGEIGFTVFPMEDGTFNIVLAKQVDEGSLLIEPEPVLDTDSGSKTEPEPVPEQDSQAEPEPDPETNPDPGSDPDPEPDIDSDLVTEAEPHSINCPEGWVGVPGNPDYNTEDFCVMKYEAKCASSNGAACSVLDHSPIATYEGTPWVSINQLDASTECESLGEGYHLITNDEWMTIATNIADQGENWNQGIVPTGDPTGHILARGHSDGSPSTRCPASSDDELNVVEGDCTAKASENDDFLEQRTHILSNGEVIWDLGGNAWEWTSYFNNQDKPTASSPRWGEYTQPVLGSETMPITDLIPQIAVDNNWNSNQGIGQYISGVNGSGGALYRGGQMNDFALSGIFTAVLNGLATTTDLRRGFRCVGAAL